MDNIVIKNLDWDLTIPKEDYKNLKLNLYSEEILFITGQEMKYEELKDQIDTKAVSLKWMKTDIKEIQHHNPMCIVQEKCLEAQRKSDYWTNSTSSTILVEDVSLNFKAMEDLPGPYIKWFLDRLKPEGLVKMLHGFEDKSAEAVCIYGILCEHYMIFCRGTSKGKIVSPRGNSGWGWDSIFEEEETGLTYSEMGEALKKKHSHRAKAIITLNHFLNTFARPEHRRC